ncbi:unnamed protein product [Thelazia callipaeda]|uniref:SSD domain-containing protein n=1 Tax=Thelazia callipaeda TaxID=103827 RepID=A0A0N5CWB1_THECL|nr:unnamed protein product [Thelazia callipaeda]
MSWVNPFGLFQDFLAKVFYKYGLIVSYYPRPFILIPFVITFILSLGIFEVKIEDDLRFLYSPTDSPARFEYSIHQSFTGDSINITHVAILVQPRKNLRNLLTKELANEILHLNDFILNNLTVILNGQTYNFGKDICIRTSFCPLSNTIVQFFFDSFWNDKLWNSPKVRLDYPFLNFFDNKFFLPFHLHGVKLGGAKGIKSIETIHLHYPIPSTDHANAETVSDALEISLRQYLATVEDSLIKTTIFSFSMLKNEMHKNALYTFPFISITILLLVAFTIFMTGDYVTSKPLEALMGVLSSSFAILSASGLLFWIGEPFVSQVTVMPFLALAIGVDDTYVMLGAWQDTKRILPSSKRMALTLQEAGSAITVTSVTSLMSFGIGSFSTTPAISIFCKFIAMAIIFDWFYQVTLFAGIMVLGGKREAAGYHCVFVWKKMPQEVIEQSRQRHSQSTMHKLFSQHIAPFLCHKITRVSLIGIYVLYLFGAIYGCSILRPNLTPSRLLVDDSPLASYLETVEAKIWPEGVISRINIMLKLAEELEHTANSLGINSTQFWLREFQYYRQFFENNDEKFYETLESFLQISFNSHWNTTFLIQQKKILFISFQKLNILYSFEINNFSYIKNKCICPHKKYVKRFFFTTGFKISDWNARTALLLQWRNITSRYAKYEALVFDDNNFYSDQMLALQSTTLSSLGAAVLALIIVSIVFIADSAIVFWVIFAMVSMDIGIAGYLSLWGANLDPTTVVNILMSIGLCIDFATHVAYRIYRSEQEDPDERIRDALGAIGWPVIQGGTSTLLAITVMILVPSHVVRMFARTSVLVVITGLFHGLVLLPVIIRSFVCFDSTKGNTNKING